MITGISYKNTNGGITEIQIMPTSVKTEGSELKNFTVFPNPTSDYIQLRHIAHQHKQYVFPSHQGQQPQPNDAFFIQNSCKQ